VVWDILEEVIKDHPILLNPRSPTLHRTGHPGPSNRCLVEGKAIKIHPLVCTRLQTPISDGDQMAVHIPLSPEAADRSTTLMLSSNNILSPAHGAPIAIPTQDMVLGCYYLTKARPGAKGEGRTFASADERADRARNGRSGNAHPHQTALHRPRDRPWSTLSTTRIFCTPSQSSLLSSTWKPR